MSEPNTRNPSAQVDRAFPLQGGPSASLLVGIGVALGVALKEMDDDLLAALYVQRAANGETGIASEAIIKGA